MPIVHLLFISNLSKANIDVLSNGRIDPLIKLQAQGGGTGKNLNHIFKS